MGIEGGVLNQNQPIQKSTYKTWIQISMTIIPFLLIIASLINNFSQGGAKMNWLTWWSLFSLWFVQLVFQIINTYRINKLSDSGNSLKRIADAAERRSHSLF
ncbi:MAG: hypothetical protein M1517_00250 [Deltaproteobacteria bacterium]|nr:hypothetical protein [Deltaproteobacteria bacterium]